MTGLTTIHRTDDGKEFASADEARDHQAKLDHVREAMTHAEEFRAYLDEDRTKPLSDAAWRRTRSLIEKWETWNAGRAA